MSSPSTVSERHRVNFRADTINYLSSYSAPLSMAQKPDVFHSTGSSPNLPSRSKQKENDSYGLHSKSYNSQLPTRVTSHPHSPKSSVEPQLSKLDSTSSNFAHPMDFGSFYDPALSTYPVGHFSSVPKHDQRTRFSQPKRKCQSLCEQRKGADLTYTSHSTPLSHPHNFGARDIRSHHEFFRSFPRADHQSLRAEPSLSADSFFQTQRQETFDTIPFPVDLDMNFEDFAYLPDLETERPKKKRASVIETKVEYAAYNSKIAEFNRGFSNDKKRRTSTSIYRGVSRCGKDNKYQARLRVNGEVMYLGRFKDEVEAARCYDERAKLYLGKEAKLNFPDQE